MTALSGSCRQRLAVLAVMVAGFASLATSKDCANAVENSGSSNLSSAETTAAQRYRVIAPRGSDLGVDVTVRSEGGATVRVAVVPDEPDLWPTLSGSEESVVTIDPDSRQATRVAFPRCSAGRCTNYAFTLELELVGGPDALVEWTARAELDECNVELESDEYYLEIRRD
jgi:hypothetical protein